MTVPERLARYPRLRFMGSKYRLAPRLAELFNTLPPGPAVDAFSRQRGRRLHAEGDRPPGARQRRAHVRRRRWRSATVANDDERLDARRRRNAPGRQPRRPRLHRDDLRRPLLRRPRFPGRRLVADRQLPSPSKRAIAIGALCLAAAWKQPRGVFTITTPRYDDGRRQLRMSLKELFVEAVDAFNHAVFEGPPCTRDLRRRVRDRPRRRTRSPTSTRPTLRPRDDT